MNDYDEINDNNMLCAVRDSLSGVPMPVPPRLEAIVARGRASRRRRRAGITVAGVATGVALVLGLSGLISAGRQAPARGSNPDRLAAFSVVTNANGTTTLTLGLPGGLIDPSAVRQSLAQHGIPALVTAGKYCTTAAQPYAPGAITIQPWPPGGTVTGQRPAGAFSGQSIVFTPSAMPAGSEVSIGYRQDLQTSNEETSVSIIEAGAPVTCRSMPGIANTGGPGTSHRSVSVHASRP